MPEFSDLDKKDTKTKKDKWPHPDAIGGREWGPFYQHQVVTTDFGDFGVEPGWVLFFVMGTQTMPDGTTRPGPVRRYRPATDAERAAAKRMHDDVSADVRAPTVKEYLEA